MTDTTDRTDAGNGAITEIRWLKRDQIVIGDQPRKHFDKAGIDELVESFKQHGFSAGVSHLLVRPIRSVRIENAGGSQLWFVQRTKDPGFRVQGSEEWETVATAESDAEAKAKALDAEMFELVCGERRLRASEILGPLIEKVPAVVEEMDDLSVLQLQLVENMQRESLTPMEEANAFKRLKEMGESQESIAERIGKSPMYVSHRITLCRLEGSAVAEALEKGAITFSHARALARIPSFTLRDELLQKVLHPPDGSQAPWPQEALEAHIKLDYMIDLRTARFDPTDEKLVLVDFEDGHEFENEHRIFGGSCLDCPLRVQASGKGNPALCTNPQCFQMKEIAAHEKWRALFPTAAGEEGEVITLSHAENAELWNESGRALAFHSPYVELDQAPATSELRADVEVAYIWRHLIKDQAVPIVLGRDTAGKVHELVRHDLAKKSAHLNGHKIFRDSEREQRTDDERSSTATAPVKSADERSREGTLATRAELDQEREIQQAEMAAIVAAAEGTVRKGMVELKKDFWGYAALALATAANNLGALEAILKRREWSPAYLPGEIEKAPIAQRLGFVVECLVALGGDADMDGGEHELWAKLFGVKLVQVRKKLEKATAHTKVTKVAKEEEKKAA